MMTLYGDLRWSMEPTIGIAGCLNEYQQMRAGSVYWLSLESHTQTLRFATQALAKLDSNSRAVVLGFDKVPVIVSALESDQGPADLRSYTLKGDKATAVLHLTEQLERKLKPIQRLILCLLPIESLSFLDKDASLVLQSWRDWCECNGCILLVLAYGEQAQRKCRPLVRESRFLSGIAHLTAQASQYVYQVDYWNNSLGVHAAETFLLQDKNTGFELLKTTVTPMVKIPAEVFLQRSVLEGAPIFMAEKWRIAESWQELVNTAQAVERGTFVFALYSTHELESLARTLYNLRQQRGSAVNLVVREMKQVLRNQEVQLLLECGAALVVAADTHLARFFGMLENVSSQKYNQPLIENLETAIAKIKTPEIKGIVSTFEFTTCLDTLLATTSATELDGVLVTMQPASMLTVEQMMGQLNILRKGDVACAADGIVYLFLFGCQLDFIEIALRRIFSLPFQDMVSQYQVHSERLSIEDHVRRLQIQKLTQASSLVEPADKEELKEKIIQVNNRQDKISTFVFKPYLKPLALRR